MGINYYVKESGKKMTKTKYLIIGNGIAALSAVKEIRKNDKDNKITMVSSEGSLTYYRVKLTSLISKDFTEEEVLVNKESWYEENNVEVILNKIVEELDCKNNTIKLDDGSRLEYEKLLIATGSRPFIPPINGKYKEGVFALRSLRDLNQFKDYIASKDRVTVIGGGLLGLEAVWALKEAGKEVDVIEYGPYLLARQLDEEISRKLEEELKKSGVNVYLSSQTEEIMGESSVDGVRLNGDRLIETGAVLVSAGVRPNLDLVLQGDLACDKGIIVNEKLETNIDNVYAAGDVIQRDGMVLGLWTASNEQGKIVGANMTGGQLKYDKPKLFALLQIGDIKLFSAGEINDEEKVYEYKADGVHNKIFTRQGNIIGAILYGDTKDMTKLRPLVFENRPVEEFLEINSQYK